MMDILLHIGWDNDNIYTVTYTGASFHLGNSAFQTSCQLHVSLLQSWQNLPIWVKRFSNWTSYVQSFLDFTKISVIWQKVP